ncbi:MAG: hypothetical protein IJ158_14420 [Treponema sp.]|nr:hypothetical protein [Treponema sp.]
MAIISDFIKTSKSDSCKHLSSGMSYSAFTQWAGFFIPDFDPNKKRNAGSPEDIEIRNEISSYTQMRVSSAHDILLLFCHAISESISENVTWMNGTVNVDFLSKCKNPTEFLDTVKEACEKYSNKIKVHPFLGIDTDNENNLPLAEMLLDSDIFEGIELYGRKYAENPEKFLSIFKTARTKGIESRISCVGFHGMQRQEDIFEIIRNLRPTHLLNPNIALNNDALKIFENGKICQQIFEMKKEFDVYIEFSPAPILSGNKSEQKAHAIREFAEMGIPFSLCSEDMLFLNKSISEFAADLCNMGVFSIEEMSQLISDKPSKA